MKVRDEKVDKFLEDKVIPSKTALALTEAIERIYERLGRPTDCTTEAGWKMADELVQLWYTFYPWELVAWKKEALDELELERTPREAGDMGYFPISYPTRLYNMFSTYLPDQKLQDRRFIHKMIIRHPVFKRSNYA